MTVRKRVLVSGRVQGVFYRDTCRRVAAEQDVSGWARNLRDGRVEIVAEGEPDGVDRMVTWAREGTPWAEVTGVEVIDEDPTGEDGFRIR
jgi:acylphosphatase